MKVSECDFLVSINMVVLSAILRSDSIGIFSTIAKQTHDDLWKCGRVTQLLRQCVKDYATVAGMYGSLYETSFDADDGTLAHIQVSPSYLTKFKSTAAVCIIFLITGLAANVHQHFSVD